MKQRIISAFAGLALLLVSIFLYRTAVFDAIVCLVYVIAVYEVYGAMKEKDSLFLSVAAAALGVAALLRRYIPFMTFDVCVFLFATLYAGTVVVRFHSVDFKTVSAALAYEMYILAGIYSIMNIRLNMPRRQFGYDSAFMIILCMALAWGGDICAYFSGYFFGKHKMSPTLSPKKTVEGAVGGIAGSVVFGFLFIYIYSALKPIVDGGGPYRLRAGTVAPLIAVFIISSVISIVGDLFASAVKRQAGIKDYGNIMPGHGGVLDRFDSVIILAPFINLLSYFVIRRGGVFLV